MLQFITITSFPAAYLNHCIAATLDDLLHPLKPSSANDKTETGEVLGTQEEYCSKGASESGDSVTITSP